MKKIMKKVMVVAMATVMLFNMSISVKAACEDWHYGSVLRTYCSTPICNYSGGGIPYLYREVQYYRNCITDSTGEAYKEYKTVVENPGCC
uniref:hypothetical protein n=1 Tax=Acetatifactor sp. TaxID=1872090 RepID=UPI004055D887